MTLCNLQIANSYCADVNDSRFLPDDLVALIRQDLRLPISMSSTLPLVHSAPQSSLDRQVAPQDETILSDHAARLRWLEDELEATACLDTLIARTTHLLEQLKTQKRLQRTREPVAIDGVEADYHARLHDLHQHHHIQPNQELQSGTQNISSQTSTPLPDSQQVQAPITGGADWEMPTLHPNVYAGMLQILDSDMGTQPSTQDYYHGDPLFGMPSFLGSSQSSYDAGSFMVQDQGQAAPAHSPALAGPSNYPPSSYFPESQWSTFHDARLDVPGSLRMPQIIAEEYASARLAADIDQSMETSPSASPDARRAASQTPTDFVEEACLSGADWYE